MKNKIDINVIKMLQDLTFWALKQPLRQEWIWTKNKILNDLLEKWGRKFDNDLLDVQATSQVLSMEEYCSKGIDDYYETAPLQGGISGDTVSVTDTQIIVSGSSSTEIFIEVIDRLNRTILDGDYLRFQGYIQPITNNVIPYIAIEDDSGYISDFVGLSGGWNDITIKLTDTPTGLTTLNIITSTTQEYLIKDYNIFYKRSEDIRIRNAEKTPDEYITTSITGVTDVYDYPTFSDGSQFNISLHSVSGVTMSSTGQTQSDTLSVSGIATESNSYILIETDCPLYYRTQTAINYGNMLLTGSTKTTISLVDSSMNLIEKNDVYSYLSNDVLIYDSTDITNSGSTEVVYIKIEFETPVTFSFDFTYSYRGGFFYSTNPNTKLADILNVNFIIYISDKDIFAEEYLTKIINEKRPVTQTFTYVVY